MIAYLIKLFEEQEGVKHETNTTSKDSHHDRHHIDDGSCVLPSHQLESVDGI